MKAVDATDKRHAKRDRIVDVIKLAVEIRPVFLLRIMAFQTLCSAAKLTVNARKTMNRKKKCAVSQFFSRFCVFFNAFLRKKIFFLRFAHCTIIWEI